MASPASTSSSSSDSAPPSDYGDAYPHPRKVYVEEGRVRVPTREVTLSGGEPAVRLYDTSGPLGIDPHVGLHPLRREWIADRGDLTEVRAPPDCVIATSQSKSDSDYRSWRSALTAC